MSKLILIAGGTASGKTEISEQVINLVTEHSNKFSLIKMDNYYYDIYDLNVDSPEKINWDKPEVINWNDLIKDINKLKNNKTVYRKEFNFDTSTYFDNKEIIIKPSEVLLIEGIFALYNEELNDKADLRIFVEADADVRIIRRILRDSNERYSNFDLNLFFNRWFKEIKVMHEKYVEPTKQNADFIILNNSDKKINLKKIVNTITYYSLRQN